MINVLDETSLKKFMEKALWGEKLDVELQAHLYYAFEWSTTIEGHAYWANIRYGDRVFTEADYHSLVDQLNGRVPTATNLTPEEDMWL